MMTISSPAGRRLAKAVAEYEDRRMEPGGEDRVIELIEASREAGSELVAQNFHKCEGD
tara:strand:- start:55127 stop:55300 length:174 start_codon:yes stop_codon:yes gene_type:complete